MLRPLEAPSLVWGWTGYTDSGAEGGWGLCSVPEMPRGREKDRAGMVAKRPWTLQGLVPLRQGGQRTEEHDVSPAG